MNLVHKKMKRAQKYIKDIFYVLFYEFCLILMSTYIQQSKSKLIQDSLESGMVFTVTERVKHQIYCARGFRYCSTSSMLEIYPQTCSFMIILPSYPIAATIIRG